MTSPLSYSYITKFIRNIGKELFIGYYLDGDGYQFSYVDDESPGNVESVPSLF